MKLTPIERDTILAALRVYQSQLLRHPLPVDDLWIENIATNSGDHVPMTCDGIDELCDRLNFGSLSAGNNHGP